MNVGHIVPINYLKYVKNRPFHLVLAHMVKSNSIYREFYKEEAKNGATIILDNSNYELGDAWASPEELINIYNSMESENVYLMCPEVAYNSSETALAVRNFMVLLDKKNLHPKTFGTIHGKTYSQIKECYRTVSQLTDYIGFSYRIWCEDIAIKYPISLIEKGLIRVLLINKLLEEKVIDVLKPHHLLGINDPCALYSLASHVFIKSADSSTAYIHAKNHIRFGKLGLLPHERLETKIDFFELDNKFAIDDFQNNAFVLDSLARGSK